MYIYIYIYTHIYIYYTHIGALRRGGACAAVVAVRLPVT